MRNFIQYLGLVILNAWVWIATYQQMLTIWHSRGWAIGAASLVTCVVGTLLAVGGADSEGNS